LLDEQKVVRLITHSVHRIKASSIIFLFSLLQSPLGHK